MGKVLSVYTEAYTNFVIEMLVDIKGKSKSDVVNFILKDWMGDHLEELEKDGITVKEARRIGVLKNKNRESKK